MHDYSIPLATDKATAFPYIHNLIAKLRCILSKISRSINCFEMIESMIESAGILAKKKRKEISATGQNLPEIRVLEIRPDSKSAIATGPTVAIKSTDAIKSTTDIKFTIDIKPSINDQKPEPSKAQVSGQVLEQDPKETFYESVSEENISKKISLKKVFLKRIFLKRIFLKRIFLPGIPLKILFLITIFPTIVLMTILFLMHLIILHLIV